MRTCVYGRYAPGLTRCCGSFISYFFQIVSFFFLIGFQLLLILLGLIPLVSFLILILMKIMMLGTKPRHFAQSLLNIYFLIDYKIYGEY